MSSRADRTGMRSDVPHGRAYAAADKTTLDLQGRFPVGRIHGEPPAAPITEPARADAIQLPTSLKKHAPLGKSTCQTVALY